MPRRSAAGRFLAERPGLVVSARRTSLEHYRDGYRLFAESIRQNVGHGGALRIDHVMRFFHLFWIPDELDAKRGIYVRDRHEDLVRILALESVRNQVIIVGRRPGHRCRRDSRDAGSIRHAELPAVLLRAMA